MDDGEGLRLCHRLIRHSFTRGQRPLHREVGSVWLQREGEVPADTGVGRQRPLPTRASSTPAPAPPAPRARGPYLPCCEGTVAGPPPASQGARTGSDAPCSSGGGVSRSYAPIQTADHPLAFRQRLDPDALPRPAAQPLGAAPRGSQHPWRSLGSPSSMMQIWLPFLWTQCQYGAWLAPCLPPLP